ncbi:hypothetical protein HDV57DRAFT_249838 [Trichoderma longibrachiatum]
MHSSWTCCWPGSTFRTRTDALELFLLSCANATHVKRWAVDAVLKYPTSGIMSLVVRLQEEQLSAVYQLWLEEALYESLSWHVEGSQLCIRTSSGVVTETLEGEEVVVDFLRRLRVVQATMGIPG